LERKTSTTSGQIRAVTDERSRNEYSQVQMWF